MNNKKRSMTIAAAAGLVLAAAVMIRLRRAYCIQGKSVLITGGSRGLGFLLAREFINRGARVAICGRNGQELENAGLKFSGMPVMTVICDVRSKEDVDRMLNEVRAKHGRIDVLVNNAGVIQVGPVEVMGLDDFREAMDIHFWGALHTVLGVLPEMIDRRDGRIVNISSIGGKISVPHLLPYSASKFALTGFSEGLRPELAKHNIAVTTVCPGLMRTGSPRNALFKSKHREEYAWFSISDSLPGISMSAPRAAARIVDACAAGEAEVILSLPAKLAVKFHAVFPSLTQDILELMNRLLPEPGGIGAGRVPGSESKSKLSPSWLTALTERAARAYNEIR